VPLSVTNSASNKEAIIYQRRIINGNHGSSRMASGSV
jgi:hypothetical protein